jgi:hypothetical protein
MVNRNGFLMNRAAYHGFVAMITVGIVLCMLSGCVISPTYKLSPPKPDQMSCNHPMKPSDTLIGIAISGGGSRAALFGAAGLEALANVQAGPTHSLLEDVSMISSVSGGSTAASYFASTKARKNVPVLTRCPAGIEPSRSVNCPFADSTHPA